jgi:hypothetical protein
MFLYLFGFIFLCVISFFIYIRLKYPFWALQPVFHFYDLHYWLVNVGIIRKNLPEKNKYINLKNIYTTEFETINEQIKKQICTLIKLNYFSNNENKYAPKYENIIPYFIGHSSKTYWSYYFKPELLIDNKTTKVIEQNTIIAIITSRPLHVKIKCNNIHFDVYYVDYLCVNKNNRKQNIAPQLIQTHEYNQSYKNKQICVSLFKREEELTGIIPLTIYKTYCFTIKQYEEQNIKINMLTGDKQNMYYFYNFINETANYWDILITPNISNIIELIVSENMFVKMLVVNQNIEAVYIFKKTCTFIKQNQEIISCIASVYKRHSILTENDFIQGFKTSLQSITQKYTNFIFVTVEDISDNIYIINNLCLNTYPIAISPIAYFFYNFAYSPFKSEKCFILN